MFTTRSDEIGNAGAVDMGFHYSMPNPADIDGDGDVGLDDYAILAGQWQTTGHGPDDNWAAFADMNRDGAVNIIDLNILIVNWLQ